MSSSLALFRYLVGFDGPVYGLLLKGTNQPAMTFDPANYASKVNPLLSIVAFVE